MLNCSSTTYAKNIQNFGYKIEWKCWLYRTNRMEAIIASNGNEPRIEKTGFVERTIWCIPTLSQIYTLSAVHRHSLSWISEPVERLRGEKISKQNWEIFEDVFYSHIKCGFQIINNIICNIFLLTSDNAVRHLKNRNTHRTLYIMRMCRCNSKHVCGKWHHQILLCSSTDSRLIYRRYIQKKKI